MTLVFAFKFCLFVCGLLILGIFGGLVVWMILLDFGLPGLFGFVYGRILVDFDGSADFPCLGMGFRNFWFTVLFLFSACSGYDWRFVAPGLWV